MSAERPVFLDANVLLYLASNEPHKASMARALLIDPLTDRRISTQIVGEIANVARRKSKKPWAEIAAFIRELHRFVRVESVHVDDQFLAFSIAHATGYSFWDSQMLATASRVGAEIVYSEDLQHGRVVGPLTIRNPFLR